MFTIFLGLTPFIFVTLLGFLFGRFKIFDLSHAKILNLFLYYVAVPALIIKFVAQSEIGRHKGLKILAACGVPVRVWPRAPLR